MIVHADLEMQSRCALHDLATCKGRLGMLATHRGHLYWAPGLYGVTAGGVWFVGKLRS